MALVEIARILDLTEAQTAAAALRASGIETLVQGEHHGQTFYLLQQALGGFGLWVDSEEAADARAFIQSVRNAPPEPVEPKAGRKGVVAAALGLILSGAALILGG